MLIFRGGGSMADNFGLKIGVEGEREFKKSLREINQSFRVLGSEMKLVTSEFDRNDKSIKAITARNAVLNKEIDAQKEKISTLEKALANAAESFGENDRRTLSWQTQLNNANAELNNLERELKDSQEEVKNLNREKVEKLVNGLKTAGEIAGKVLVAGLKAAAAAMAAIGTGAVASGKFIKDSLNVYGEYEDAMKQVQATMGLAGEEGEEAFNKLSQAAKDAGASTRFSASESAEALNYLALAGYDTEQAIGALPRVLTLAAAGDMDLARASDLVTDSMAALGLEIADMDMYMDKMAKTSQKSNTDVQQLGEGILVAGATMKNAGQDLDTLNVMLGVLANRGIKGAEGGTKLRNIIMSLTSPTSAAAKELESLGISVTDSSGNIRDMNDIFTDLNKELDGLSEADKMNALSNIFNKQDLAGVNALLSGTGDEMNNLYKELENADGAAQQMSDTMESGLAGSVRSLKSAYEGLQIVIGEQFAEMAQGAVGDVTELVRDITEILNDGFQEGDITAIGKRISSFLIQGINRITEYIPGAIDMIATMLTELVNVLVELLPTLLPPLLEGAIALLTGIIEAIVGNIEPLVEMVVYLVTTVAEFIIENLPILIEAAIQIVIALANGIAGALPQLIPAVIDAIILIVDTLINNLGQILNAALRIIMALAEGIVAALPRLIAALPQIINSIINFITSNLPMIIDMGIRIILQLVVGIIKAIPSLVAALPQIVMALITGIGKAAIAIVEIGRNIVRGLWDGIASMVTWIKDKISNFVGGIVSGVKGLLGIKSPSTVFAGIGDDMAQGLGVGFDKAMSQVSEDIQDAVPTDFDIQSNVNVGANGIATSQDGYGSLITIQQMIVRSEDDIRKVSQELYNLIQTGSRAQGRFVPS
ncbi:phage tail tape measure protein [Listeria monocytogenes]|nr:phage tail tape measure protein [Listeria monocytogenes]EAE5214632.1 phage tail tape measure protein [Listeria monocytogenes]